MKAFSLIFLLSLTLASCSNMIATFTPTALPATQTPLPSHTSTPLPTATSTPAPPLAVLLAAPEADQSLASALQTALYEQITSAGMRWQVRRRLEDQDLRAELRLVIALPPDPGLARLVSAAPQTQFLAVGIDGLEPAPNLTVLGAQGERADQQGFIAGVMAAMITTDWRVGVISVSDTAEGRSARAGFLNGVTFFCGLCRQVYPPYYDYPLFVELPRGATTIEWQAAANYMIDHMVETVYVYPQAGDPAMLDLLATSNVNIISSGTPAESLHPHWVASLGTDPIAAIQSVLSEVIAGKGGRDFPLPLSLYQVNPDLLSPGKQERIAEILADLLAGYIDTGVDLATGESR